MAFRRTRKFDEKDLTKGESRKLNALRKPLGDEIADKAFSEWYQQQGSVAASAEDRNAMLIADALAPLKKSVDWGELLRFVSSQAAQRLPGRGRV